MATMPAQKLQEANRTHRKLQLAAFCYLVCCFYNSAQYNQKCSFLRQCETLEDS